MTEADSGWLLRHRDGVEHGPFRLADIIAAAGTGNIAHDTSVLHKTHTQGTWVLASGIQPIAAAMSSQLGNLSRPAQAPSEPAPGNPTPNTPATAGLSGANCGSTKPASAAGTPGMASTSAFQRPAARQASVTSRSPAQRSSQPEDHPAANETIYGPPTATGPRHTIRSRQQTFPVPKYSHEAALAFFDFRFRYFVTPWIIKILWSITVTVTLLWLAVMTYSLWVQPSMDAPGPRTVDGASRWEFTPLANQSFFQTNLFSYLLLSGITLLLVLLARVALEFMIVFFRIATDIAELKRMFLKE
ncbi:MAG: DUF4282 domain-containing protein [Planctomycetota bacterium]|nr:DUF4282 domain-containing protein [Planctomycetota bacterium]